MLILMMATFVATAVLMVLVFWIIRPHVENLLDDELLLDTLLSDADRPAQAGGLRVQSFIAGGLPQRLSSGAR